MESKKQLVKIIEVQSKDEKNRIISTLVEIFRNYETGNKEYKIIRDPKYTYYITKQEVIDKELDETGDVLPVDNISINDVEPITTNYSNLLKSIATETKNEEYFYDCIKEKKFREMKKLHLLPIIHSSDVDLEDYYIAKHYEKYPYDKEFHITKAYFDIEVDSIGITGFPSTEDASCPVNAFSMYFDEVNTLFGLFLRNPDNPQIKDFEENKLSDFKKRIKKKYIEKGLADIKIKILFFDDELELISTAFDIINYLKPDYMGAWNLTGFDIPYLINRIAVLGEDPDEVMCDSEICEKLKMAYSNLYIDNRNQDFADKGSYYENVSYTNYIDQMLLFASLRKTEGKRESYSLDDITHEELGDSKISYQELGATIKTLPYVNYEIFLEYNLHDTVLLSMLEKKVDDIDMIHTIAVVTQTRVEKAYKKTISVVNLARVFYKQKGFIMSNNHNKTYDSAGSSSNKSKKFRGAFVALPTNNDNVGVKINGKRSQFVHEHVIDEDLTSLYPSIILTFNIDSTTLIGHLESLKDDAFDTSEFANDLLSDNVINFGHKYFDLPTLDTVLSDYKKSVSK